MTSNTVTDWPHPAGPTGHLSSSIISRSRTWLPTDRSSIQCDMGRTLPRIIGLSLALGASVVVAWLAVRGASVFRGPGPFLDSSWLLTWALQAGLAAAIGFGVGRWWGSGVSRSSLAIIVMAAWAGELVVVTVLAPFLAGELSRVHGPGLWLVATGGPIQPLAALGGASAGQASARSARTAQLG